MKLTRSLLSLGTITVVLVLCAAAIAAADSIPAYTITAGTVTFAGSHPADALWSFSGSGLIISGHQESPNSPSCGPCTPGQTITQNWLLGSDGSGTALVNGIYNPSVAFRGTITIQGPSITVSGGTNPVVYVPATFNSVLTAFNPATNTDLFTANFNDVPATLELTFSGPLAGNLYNTQSGSYVLSPEPGSLGLFAAGLAVLCAFLLLRRRGEQPI